MGTKQPSYCLLVSLLSCVYMYFPLKGLISISFSVKYVSHVSLQVPLSSYVYQQHVLAKLRCGFLAGLGVFFLVPSISFMFLLYISSH